jgi:type VI secretion system secreted protein VgrG
MEPQGYVSGGDGGSAEQPLVVEILATPADVPWRAPRITPWPVARGPETATVVGPTGQTIYTDEYGRVKVRFHWDRAAESPDQTCWIRVAFASADNGFGHIVLPRIGQEVVVDYLSGDPDRPLVVGSLYNGDKKPPYTLTDNKTKSVWRSHSIGGGADDYNEISFEDKASAEVFNVQAQKDRTTLVKNNDTTTIKNDLSTTIQQGDETRALSRGSRTTTIKQNDSLTLTSGNYTIQVSAGEMSVTAMQSITLTVGSSSIKIDPTGVTIKGMMIDAEGQVQLTAKAPMVQINGEAMTQVQGGIVMIN